MEVHSNKNNIRVSLHACHSLSESVNKDSNTLTAELQNPFNYLTVIDPIKSTDVPDW
jgi:hypothetical protein